jgi:uncharacterized membrane protein YjjB (DUF3815 family)
MMVLKIAAVLAMGGAVGILYRVPRNLLMYGSLTGLAAWLVFYGTAALGAKVVAASFFGSVVAGSISEILARVVRKPATIFIIPGFIPLVPGRDAYMTMLLLVEGRYAEGVAAAMTTLLIAGAIAFGIFLSTMVFRLMANYKVRGKTDHAGDGKSLD